ncbi:MAG: hypothetical protein ACJ8MH_05785 [Povalibacter sp.]
MKPDSILCSTYKQGNCRERMSVAKPPGGSLICIQSAREWQ